MIGHPNPRDRQIPILVLDVDGVVVTARPCGRQGDWGESLWQDLAIDPALLQERFFEPHWDAVVRGERGLRGVLASVMEQLNPRVSADTLISYWFRRDSCVDPVVLSFARTWTGRTGERPWLASNQESMRARYLWQEIGLQEYFDGFVYSAELGLTKSDPEFFRLARSRISGAVSRNILFFDDDPQNVASAKVAFWDARLYNGAGTLAGLLPSLRPNAGPLVPGSFGPASAAGRGDQIGRRSS